ncbi:MAG: sugar ABC transporter ATP-binding protein [Clostridiales Family XIII bacterium]|jgi:ribose transport system ATP-binding protein|nr:sugar ABC transporter ATP-binding protein [Clostridiales Family XIII bacterium]
MSDTNTLFACKGISKEYGNTKALQDISFSVNKGEIVGLVGENGAGKSTLMKIMQGVETPTTGEMTMRGEAYYPKNPKDANRSGVGMVFQEQSLLTNLTVAQNMFFGEEDAFKKFGIVNWRKMNEVTRSILDALSLEDIDGNQKVSSIQFSRRQMVEIAKVLNRASQTDASGSLILLDEPTSVLSSEEIEILFGKVQKLKADGNGVVFISHRLDEIMEIADKVVVFKDGHCVAELVGDDINEEMIFQKMIGKGTSSEFYKVHKQTEPGDEILIDAQGLSMFGYFKDVDFTLRSGEVVGIYGVVGSGKENLCGVLSGDEKHTEGHLKVKGKTVQFSSPHKSLKAGISCVPTERRVEGQVGIASIRENISYSCMHALTKMGLLSSKKDKSLTDQWIKDLRIKCEGGEQAVENLSGGNAQKVVFARVLSSDSDVIILNHPTRGVDVGAKEEIYDIIRDATARGMGVILQGDTLDECIGLSNKILVMKDGFVTKIVEAAASAKPKQIDVMQHMM